MICRQYRTLLVIYEHIARPASGAEKVGCWCTAFTILVLCETLSRCSQVLWHLTWQSDLIFGESSECSEWGTQMLPFDATYKWRANSSLLQFYTSSAAHLSLFQFGESHAFTHNINMCKEVWHVQMTSLPSRDSNAKTKHWLYFCRAHSYQLAYCCDIKFPPRPDCFPLLEIEVFSW